MKLLMAALAASLLLCGAALASSGHCPSQPRSDWRSRDEVKAAAEALGFDVRRLKTEDGCYEVYGVNKDGTRMEIYFDPVSLQGVRRRNES